MTVCTCHLHDQCENCLSQAIYDYARLQGWLVEKTPTWRKTCGTPGYPDLTMMRRLEPTPTRIVFAELKREKGGKLSPAQKVWEVAILGGRGVEHYVWKPSDWSTLEAILRRPPAVRRLPPKLRDPGYDNLPQGVTG